VNGLYKTELIRGPGHRPWKTVEDVELATLGWVHWHNTERLHGYLGDIPPAEFESAYHASQERIAEPIGATPHPDDANRSRLSASQRPRRTRHHHTKRTNLHRHDHQQHDRKTNNLSLQQTQGGSHWG
jgi:hypothetical protein